MTPGEIERLALEIRRKTTMDVLPVPVEKIARMLGMKIQPADLGDEVSGVLVIEGGQTIIGVNADHPEVRQRFTIAHEIGHFILQHHTHTDLFVDDGDFLAVYRRDNPRSRDNKRERDANTFAGALLMPKDVLERELGSRSLGLFDDPDWKALAERFDVSRQALLIRLTKLGFFGPSY